MRMLRKLLASPRGAYIAQNAVWLWLALAAILSAVAFFANPASIASSPIGQLIHPYDFIWNAGWLLSGVLLLVGIVRMHADTEALGLMVFGLSLSIYTVALLALNAPLVGLAAYPALILAALLRVAYLVILAQAAAALKAESKKPGPGAGNLVALAPLPALLLIGADSASGVPVSTIILAIVGLFGGTSFAAYRMIRPQRTELAAKTADAITVAADRIIDRQEKEITELRNRIALLEAKVLHQAETDMALARVTAQRDAADAAVGRLVQRVEELVVILQNAGLRVPPEAHSSTTVGRGDLPA